MTKTLLPQKKVLRVWAVATFFIISALLIIFRTELSLLQSCFLGAFSALCCLSFYPVSQEITGRFLLYALILDLFFVLLILFVRKKELFIPFYIFTGVASLFLYSYVWSKYKFRQMKSLFRQKSVLVSAQEYNRVVVKLGISAISCLFVSFPDCFVIQLISLLLVLSLYILVHLSCYNDRVLLLSKKKEMEMRELIKGNLRALPHLSDDEDARMSALYARITSFMETDKPFLHDKYTVREMARDVYSNRSYLSKTINYFSGRNFNQFLNYYRVMYAINLMKKDHNLKVSELSSLSGFHSVVSFNMAFRMYVEDTPASYREQIHIASKLHK